MDSSIKQQVKGIEFFLTRINPITVVEKISAFRKINIRNLSDEELFHAIQNTLLNNNIFSYLTNSGVYSVDTPFFRVRKLDSSIVSEMHLNENDWYALIKYVATKEIKVNIIGGIYDYVSLGFSDERAIVVHELYNSFLRDEFSRDVGDGTEYLYRISERIAKDYFDLPKEIQDAWCYSSIQDKSQYNVCFRPERAHELLMLKGALICKKEKDETIKPRCVAIATDNQAEFFH